MSIKNSRKAKVAVRKITGTISFGEVLKPFSETRGWTQVEMANVLGISKQDLCNIEKGRKIVSVDRCVKFAKALNHSPSVFAKYVLEDQLMRAGIPNEIKIVSVA